MLWDGGDEGHEASPAEELGDEESGVGLGLRGFDPLKAFPQHAGVAAPFSKDSAPIAAHN